MGTALLIDAENVSTVFWPQMLQQVGRKCRPVGKVFADFASGRCKQWREIAEQEGFALVMRPGGSNATDIAIAIAAMELRQTGQFDTFYLASSDRDYTPLVERLRSDGLIVVGLGEAKAPSTLRAACSRFVVLKKRQTPTLAKAA
ncbi:MAG TPA: NYN domain-containing protein [Devosia sp.]|jgi:hypothetical protein|nr:NYN domain-containing protein [Devosia sp.]